VTAETYYRHAAFFPIALPAIAGAFLFMLVKVDVRPIGAATDGFGDTSEFIATADLLSAVPYAFFVRYVIARRKPKAEAEFRDLSWTGPPYVAGLLTVSMAAMATANVRLPRVVGFAAFVGLLAASSLLLCSSD
jgi:hypothetical protein